MKGVDFTMYKYNDDDTHEESVHFMKGNLNNYVDIPCFWILLSITHKNNISGRRAIAPVLSLSFLNTLPVSDFEYIKSLKLKLMEKDPDNALAIANLNKIKQSNNREKMIDKLSIKIRKNIFIREYLNTIPTKSTCSEIDYLILCLGVRPQNDRSLKEMITLKAKNIISFWTI